MKLVFASDLHILGDDDPLYQKVLTVIDQQVDSGDVLVLGGDIFDLFVGDRPVFIQRYRLFFQALSRACARGATVHYIEGNHDFHLKRAFQEISCLQLHDDEVTLKMGGKKFYIAHGDQVDRKDYGYRLLRWFFRSRLMKWFSHSAPSAWMEKIGQKSGEVSKSINTVSVHPRLRPVFHQFAQEKISQGYDYVILGHSHDCDEAFFGGGQYINNGFPRTDGAILIWNEGDTKISRLPLNN